MLIGVSGLAHRPRKLTEARGCGQVDSSSYRSNRPAGRGQRFALPTARASAHLPTASHHDYQDNLRIKLNCLLPEDTRRRGRATIRIATSLAPCATPIFSPPGLSCSGARNHHHGWLGGHLRNEGGSQRYRVMHPRPHRCLYSLGLPDTPAMPDGCSCGAISARARSGWAPGRHGRLRRRRSCDRLGPFPAPVASAWRGRPLSASRPRGSRSTRPGSPRSVLG
jgi:hypothetical protein